MGDNTYFPSSHAAGVRLDRATALAIGFGLHNAWVSTAMYSSDIIFGMSSTMLPGVRGGSISLLYLSSIAMFCLIMFMAARFDQKLSTVSRSRKVMALGAIVTCLGTLLALVAPADPGVAVALECCSGVITGFGSAVLLLYWGIAFAREKVSTIAITGAIAIALGFALNTLFLQSIPAPFGGVVSSVFPLLEFFILRSISPRQPAESPLYFNALPTSKSKLGMSLMGPLIFIGLALGVLKQASVQTSFVGVVTPMSLIILLLAGSLTISLFTFYAYAQKKQNWDRFLRVIVPAMACASLFVSLLVSESVAFSDLFLLIAYIFIEALVWVSYPYISHKFHLSPIFLIGLSRGILTLSMLFGALIVSYANPWLEQLPLSDAWLVVIPLVLIALGYALMPKESELVQKIVQCPAVRLVTLELEENLGLLEAHTTAARNARVVSSDASAAGVSEDLPTSDTEAPEGTTDELAQQLSAIAPITAASSTEAVRDQGSMTASGSFDDTAPSEGRFSRRVKKVAKTFLLTDRETDILFELAKGNSPAYIQEKYYISTGTVKTHIRNIYRKLDIHKRNDLLRLIEDIDDYD